MKKGKTVIKAKPASLYYYGWAILIASFFMLSINSASQFAIGVMFKPILLDLGWNRAEISLGVLINMSMLAFSMLIVGKAYDRFGPKWVIVVCATFLAAGFIGVSRMATLVEFYFYYGFLCGIGFSGTTALIFTALLSKWFNKGRGLAIAVGLSGGQLGQFFLIPWITSEVIQNGWKPTYFAIGLIIWLVNVVLAFGIVKGDPQALGQALPDNRLVDAPASRKASEVIAETESDFGFRDAAKTASFWIYVGVMLVCGAGDFFVTTHLVAFVTDFGLPQESAGKMLAWLGLMGLLGALFAGAISDYFGNKALITGTFIIRALLFVLLLQVQNEVTFYIFSLGFGFTLMITAVLTVTLIGKLYGFTHIGTLTAFVTTIHHLAGGLLVYGGGLTFDFTNSYSAVFVLYAGLSVLAVMACIFIKEKKHYLTA